MRIIRTKDYNDMSRKTANMIAAQVMIKPDSLLGLATGASPIGTYKCLVEDYKNGNVDFSKISSVNLDEYYGIGADNDQSFHYFMNHHFFNHVNIKIENTHIPDGLAKDPQKECDEYEEIIRSKGGVDLQLMGLGINGHIGYNEPANELILNAHCTDLAPATIEANKSLFADISQMPLKANTMGLGTIMRAKAILMIVSGEAKAKIVNEAFFGPITTQIPASLLQLHHNFTLIGDEAAFSQIPK